MEGLPEPVETPVASRAERVGIRDRAKVVLGWVGDRIPGLVMAAGLAYVASGLGAWLGEEVLQLKSGPISGIPIAILLGALICNLVGVPEIYHRGLGFCILRLQRIAIVLLGLRLSFGAVGVIGLGALPVIIACILFALLLVPVMGKWVKLPARLTALIAVGTSICGVSAIMATAPAIKAKEGETSYAVACVAVFGMLATLIYPFIIASIVGTDPLAVGVFLGTAIHDTSQVTGAALAYQEMYNAPEVLNSATVVKIVRNLSMVLVLPLMAWIYNRVESSKKGPIQRWQQVVPVFVLGFLGMTLVRSFGDLGNRPFGLIEPAIWKAFLSFANTACVAFLTMVMAAIGLSTHFGKMRVLGVRPMVVGLSASLTVGLVSFGMIQLCAALGLF